MPHVIRLRGPWEFEIESRSRENAPRRGTLHLPGDLARSLGDDFTAVVRLSRRFHRPTGLESGERVWLTTDKLDHQAAFTLNGQPLALNGALRAEVTSYLQASNVLTIEIAKPSVTVADILGFIALEIGSDSA
jgi:hypothetical protein